MGRKGAPALGKAGHRVEGFASPWRVIRCGTDAQRWFLVILRSWKRRWESPGRTRHCSAEMLSSCW